MEDPRRRPGGLARASSARHDPYERPQVRTLTSRALLEAIGPAQALTSGVIDDSPPDPGSRGGGGGRGHGHGHGR